MPKNKKEPTKWEIAKPILEKAYLDGEVTDDMKRSVVWGMKPEFKAVPINNFGTNWNLMKKNISSLKRRAAEDAADLKHDRDIFPIQEEGRWDGSEAQALLKMDVKDDFHLHFSPVELWSSRSEYQEFPIEIFSPHVHQEKRAKLESNYWLVKKWKKSKKLVAEMEEQEDDTQFNTEHTGSVEL